ncbi:NfeD family protein [Reichenbachiella ulvae]|uniref:NfeD family protein n=1 Tax=Reichenbachiella ulvae TaxID=2980104 RepID=A0ABT3CWU3_9BACT|nr:NfeD family protein [Reichenbachiella ulvae]MCV9387999.1 NfeD family protein [Reichenbachiella ulvae]
MTDWIIIISLILGGIGLIIIEIIFVPGTTIVGIGGFLLSGYGIYHSYELYGSGTGHTVLAVSLITGVGLVVYSFKAGHWERFALKQTMEGKVNEGLTSQLTVGMTGVAKSTLRPVGKAEFDNKEYEVTTLGDYVDASTQVEIIKVDSTRVYVKPIIN